MEKETSDVEIEDEWVSSSRVRTKWMCLESETEEETQRVRSKTDGFRCLGFGQNGCVSNLRQRRRHRTESKTEEETLGLRSKTRKAKVEGSEP
ncbi:hypothetical protein Csa_006145, partial [Cucumis sativus]|uniref:Uncharacterized protein n=1 Tax=Cucumis sativus TaxID=3659 RepID=A0A0A0LMI2_CUCSA